VAKRQAITNPENTVFSIKRFMGRRFNEVTDEMKMVPFKAIQQGDHRGRSGPGEGVHPAEISAMILQKLKKSAEGLPRRGRVTEAVITVPAYFNDAQPPRPPRTRARSPASTSKAHRQRAHCGRARLRPRQKEGRDDCGL